MDIIDQKLVPESRSWYDELVPAACKESHRGSTVLLAERRYYRPTAAGPGTAARGLVIIPAVTK
eukprot:751926-Hanusia_phi.AAC.3